MLLKEKGFLYNLKVDSIPDKYMPDFVIEILQNVQLRPENMNKCTVLREYHVNFTLRTLAKTRIDK